MTGRIWRALQRTRLQQWPYPELKNTTDKQIEDFYTKIGFEGTVERSRKIEASNNESLSYHVGYGIIVFIFSYCMTWLVMIGGAIWLIYSVMHHAGGK